MVEKSIQKPKEFTLKQGEGIILTQISTIYDWLNFGGVGTPCANTYFKDSQKKWKEKNYALAPSATLF